MSLIKRVKNILTFTDNESESYGMWTPINSIEAVDAVFAESNNKAQVVLKHSTRCSVSLFAKLNVEKFSLWRGKDADLYIIDVIKHRPVSQYFAERSGVAHESPQILIIRNEKAVWNESHSRVNSGNVEKAFAAMKNA